MQVMPQTGRAMKVGDIAKIERNVLTLREIHRVDTRQIFCEHADGRAEQVVTLAFAAYNAGPSRIKSLRGVAEKRGLDPNVWFDNVEIVAADKIGRETVTYVRNIYKYYIAYRLVLDRKKERDDAVNTAAGKQS